MVIFMLDWTGNESGLMIASHLYKIHLRLLHRCACSVTETSYLKKSAEEERRLWQKAVVTYHSPIRTTEDSEESQPGI